MSRCRHSLTSGGFTLVELMVALAVLGILVVVAVPNYGTFVANQRVKTASQDLLVTMNYTRSEAIKRNAQVIVQPLDNDDWSSGWEVVTADGQRLRVSQAESIAGVEIDGGTTTQVTFLPSGRVQTSATFSACDSGNKAMQRSVAVNASGRSQITLEEKCS